MNTSSSSESSCPPAELSSDTSSDTGSESGTHRHYDDPKRTVPKAALYLKDFIKTELYEGKSEVIIKLHQNGNIAHGRLSKSIRKLISKTVVQRVVEKLSEGGKLHWNNVTWSLQIKQNIDIQADRFLCLDTMNEFFPEFKQSVVESLTQIDYIDEDELHFHATLTLKSGRGTDHGDLRLQYKTRIIFTFMLKKVNCINNFVLDIAESMEENRKLSVLNCTNLLFLMLTVVDGMIESLPIKQ